MSASPDWGKTWSEPVEVSRRPSAVLPWVSGGAGDRAVVTYLAGDTMSDSDRGVLTEWDVTATLIDGVGSVAPLMVETVVDRAVHRGSVCTTGTTCGVVDRSLLDFFESDVMPDGRIVIAYAAKPFGSAPGFVGPTAEVRVALQNGGTPLFVRP